MSSGPIDVALIGYGLGGAAFHAPLIHFTPGLRLAFIVTGNPDRSADASRRFPGARVVADPRLLWTETDRPALVVVSTPNRTHVPLARAALEAGCHVVVDKPLAASAGDARALIDTAARQDRLLTVYQNRRWDADYLTLRRLLAAGELGTVHRFESRFERWRAKPKPGWRQEPDPREAGGILYDLGAHLIDQALALFGPVVDVYAELDSRRPGARVDDDAFVALTHASGVRSHLWMNMIAAEPGPRFRVLGSRATWTKSGLDPQEAWLREGRGPDEPGYGVEATDAAGRLTGEEGARSTPSERGDYPAFYAAVLRAIRVGGPPPVDPADAVTTLEIIERARAAAAASGGAWNGGARKPHG